MKTSNKLILISSLSALGVFGAVHLALLSNYRNGRIHSEDEMNQDRFTAYHMSEPAWLSLKGQMHADIIPSDSFHIELEKNVPGLTYRMEGDSLIISGPSSEGVNPHGSWNEYWQWPRVYIFYSRLKNIRAEGSYLAYGNPEGTPGQSARFMLKDAQLWIGAFNPQVDSVFLNERFDSIQIGETNSTVVLNRQAQVARLSTRLDNQSEIIDRYCRIDTGWMVAAPYAKIYLMGRNFNKISLRVEEQEADRQK